MGDGVFVANYGGPMKLFEMTDAGALRDVGESAGIALTTGGRALLALPVSDGRWICLPVMRMARISSSRIKAMAPLKSVQQLSGSPMRHKPCAVRRPLMQMATGTSTSPGTGGAPIVSSCVTGAFTLATPSEMESPSRIRTVIAADFDNDGYEEIFWNNIGEPNRLFKQTPDGWRHRYG